LFVLNNCLRYYSFWLIGERGGLAVAVVVGLCNEGGDMGSDLSLLVSLGVEEKQRKMSSFDGGFGAAERLDCGWW